MATSKLDSIILEVQRLSLEDQLQLIKRVADILAWGKRVAEGRGLIYGKYHDPAGKETMEEDFRLAEWHPTEKDLNGA